MARITFKPLEYLDGQAVAELAAVGPIDEYIKHDQNWTLGGFAVLRKGQRIGSMALRAEQRPDGAKVLVIVAASVKDRKSVIVEGIEGVKKMARANGFQYVRAHSERIGVVKAFLNCGGVAVLGFATDREYHSADLATIQTYMTAGDDAVMLVEV